MPPIHIGPSLPVVAVGTAFTVTAVVYVLPGLQPDAVLLTVNVYTDVPVDVGIAVVDAVEVVPIPGPLHA